MSPTISVRIKEDTLKELDKIEKEWHIDRSESIRRLLNEAIKSWKIENSLEKLKQHKISIGKAAEECNISIWEIMDLAKEKNIDWMSYTKEDLERELKILEK